MDKTYLTYQFLKRNKSIKVKYKLYNIKIIKIT